MAVMDALFPPFALPDKSPIGAAAAVLSIDLGALQENYRLLRSVARGLPSAAVVKADAYGLGVLPVTSALFQAGCRHFFVALAEEAFALSGHLPGAEVFVLHGPAKGEAEEMAGRGIVPVLNSRAQIDRWRNLAQRLGRPLDAILQIDSGMSRLGLSPLELDDLAANPSALAGISLRYVMSHLAAAENPDAPSNARQLAVFQAARGKLPLAPASFANSSGVFLGPDYHCDLLRPGAALYGIAPTLGRPNPLHPVVRLQARVIQMRQIPAGTAVGYGGHFVAPRETRIATASIGYADGFLRALGNRTWENRAGAGAKGQRLPIIGAISMDTITLDATELPEGSLSEGDWLDIIGGDGPSIDEIANQAGTIGYEILTCLGHRYRRNYLTNSFSCEGKQL